MAGTIGQFKSDHHIVFGVSLLAVGVFGIIGSLTGSLAVMLAALFDPGALVDGSGGGGGVTATPAVGKATSGEEPSDGEPSSTEPNSGDSTPSIEPPSSSGSFWTDIGDLGI